MILTCRGPQSKLALSLQFGKYRHYCSVRSVLYIFTGSSRVWQAKEIALESSDENNFNEGALYSDVTRIKRTNRGTPSAKETGRKSSTQTQGELEAIKKGFLSRSCCQGGGSYKAPSREGTGENCSHLPSLSSHRCLPLAPAGQKPDGRGTRVHRSWPPGMWTGQRRQKADLGSKQRSSRSLRSSKILPSNTIKVPLWQRHSSCL